MCRSISSLVVGVDAKVQSHELVERRVVVSKHSAKVTGIIQGCILGDNTVKVDIAVNHSSNLWQNCNHTQNILESVDVVVGLWRAIGVGFRELRLGLAGIEANAQLSHGMHVLWKAVDQCFDVLGELGTRVQFGGKRVDLFLGRNLRRQKQPQKTFQERLTIASHSGVGRKNCLALGNGQSTESDTFGRIQVRSLPYHAFDGTSSTNALVDSDFSDDVIPMVLFQCSNILLLFWNLCGQCFLKCGNTAEFLPDGNLADELLNALG
mmetsp:Transcript_3469/g.8256  ORF Transcript_3469/g.8256 Transcript_3469/m.8256 type:complete len:265 (+) Transcript_3469:789-1583(+)